MRTVIQHFLSPRPARTTTSHLNPVPDTGLGGAITLSFHVDPATGLSYVREQHHASSAIVKAGKSGPPKHIHLKQTEYFTVIQGKIKVTLESRVVDVTKASGEVQILPGTRHTFSPIIEEGAEEDLIVDIRADPQENGFSEDFIRNVESYLHDCTKSSMSPSPFQIILFLCSANTLLALPIPLALNKMIHWFAGVVVGSWILGYQSSYEEYFLPQSKTK